MNSVFMKKMAYLTMNEVKFLCITKPVDCSFFTYHMTRNDRRINDNVVKLNEISIREYPVR